MDELNILRDIARWLLPIYIIIGFLLGFLYGEWHYALVWILAWPIKLVIGVYNSIRNRSNK